MQGHLGGKLRRAGEFEKRVLLLQRTVFRKGAPGLTHQPDRRFVDGQTPAGIQKTFLATRQGGNGRGKCVRHGVSRCAFRSTSA